MTNVRARRPASVVWVELSTVDLEGAIHFYERLFRWHYAEQDTEMGTFITARVAAGPVGGMMARAPEHAAVGASASWTVFVGVGHLETTVSSTRALGGSVLQSPLSNPGGARVAVIADPAGAALGLMEAPLAASGVVRGPPGSVCWVECLSRDLAASRRFHQELLGWTSEEGPHGYVVFGHGGERVGGLTAMPPSAPAQALSHWLVYFAVADVAASCTSAVESGGRVFEPAHDIEEGRFAVLDDPAGAAFGIFERHRLADPVRERANVAGRG